MKSWLQITVTCLPTVSPCKAKMVWYLSSWDFKLMFSSSSSLIRTSSASTFVPTLPILKEEYLKYVFSYHELYPSRWLFRPRQTGSDTLRYFGKSTDIFLFLRVASRPSNTSSQPSDTHSLRPRNSGPECLKSVISVTLDISGVAAHPDIGPTVPRKCGKYIRVEPEGCRGGHPHLGTIDACTSAHCTVWGHIGKWGYRVQ